MPTIEQTLQTLVNPNPDYPTDGQRFTQEKYEHVERFLSTK